jgi:hypothetical protein
METLKRPYEFLIRWKDGAISGAHVGYEVTVTEDGNVLSTTPLPVVPVDVGTGQGFPLADILCQVQIDALKDRESAINTANLAGVDKKIAEDLLIVAKEQIAEKNALIKSLQDKVADLEKANGTAKAAT